MSLEPSPRGGTIPSKTIRGLDGLRAIAIVLVILWHCATRYPREVLGPLKGLVDAGWTGVDLFFALSGFLITTLILEEERQAGGGFSLANFYARRALRILPPFYLVLVLNLVLVDFAPFQAAVGTRVGGPLELVSLVSYWSNYFFIYFESANPAQALLVYWSLCVEEHFYLLWPLFLLVVKDGRMRLLTGLLACVMFLTFRVFGQSNAFAVQTLSHFRMDSILWGALAALGFAELVRREARRRLSLALLLGLVVTMFLTGFISTAPGRLEHAISLSVLAICFALLVAEVAASPDSLFTKALDVPPLRSLGKVSYGMYLLHMQAISLATGHIALLGREPSAAVFLLFVALTTVYTYLASLLMYRFYEVRFLALKKRFGRLGSASGPSPQSG